MKLSISTLLLIGLLVQTTTAQYSDKHTIKIDWITSTDTSYPETFTGDASDGGLTPIYAVRVNIPVNGKVTATLQNIVSDEALLTPSITNNDYVIKAHTSTMGTAHYVNISVVPIKKSGATYQKITQADLEYTITPDYGSTTRGPTFKTESVLRSGTYYKMAVTNTGAYSITGQELAEALGVPVESLVKDQLQLYSGQQGRLPEKVNAPRTDDLVETPLQITGTSSTMTATDELRFFAHGPNEWHYDTATSEHSYDRNPYSLVNYVYLRTDGSNGLRMQATDQPSGATYSSSDYDYLQRHEVDDVNLLGANAQTEGSGQEWYGDYFGAQQVQDMTNRFDFSGIVANHPAKVQYRMAARAATGTASTLTVGASTLTSSYSSVSLDNPEALVASARSSSLADVILGNAPSVMLTYDNNSSNDQAWLDYIQIDTRRQVGAYAEQTIIHDEVSIQHEVASFSGLGGGNTLWHITDQANIGLVSNTNGSWSYHTDSMLQEFLVITDYMSPTIIGPVANQNLHSIAELDMLILYADTLRMEAERLAAHRSAYSGLNVRAVDVAQVYNEFSSGKMDPTALRDFAKMIHDRTSNFQYLLLLGDASYDYRNLVQGVPNHNLVPCYQTRESLNPLSAFPSDDYFGLLSDDEGGSTLLIGDLDVQVGRLPASDPEVAANMVEKIIAYDTNPNRYGDWRLNIGFAADDEDTNTHIDDSDQLARAVQESDPQFNQQKVYFDAFEQISTPGGDRYPDVSTAINTSIQNGQLVLNYLGHGGPSGWAQERVLKNTDIDTWNNEDQMPILLTATCTFTGYDDPSVVSSGEYAIRKKDGGCVALMTTVRAVFANQNAALANSILENLFKLGDDGKARTLGEIMTIGKNNLSTSSDNMRKFALIGDPAMNIAIPTEKVVATSINGTDINSGTLDTLRALEEVTLSGIVTSQSDQKISGFDGVVSITVFDKQSTLETRVNDSGSRKKSFEVYKNVLFKGAATVENGEFTITFVLPKDINYRFGQGRISMYAHNGTSLDAAGYFDDVIIGGSSDEVVTDDEGPTIELFMNDTNFKDGGITNKNATLLVHLADDLGINTSGTSIGHDLTATIDDDQVYVLNNFYKANIDNAKRGVASFPLNDLSVGMHTARVKAWDLANNSAEATITFEVLDGEQTKVSNLYIYPNPVSSFDWETLVFEHDLLGNDLLLELDIFNTAGQYVAHCEQPLSPTGNRVEVPMNTPFYQKLDDLPVGMYFYKIKLTTTELSTFRESDFEKLVKVR